MSHAMVVGVRGTERKKDTTPPLCRNENNRRWDLCTKSIPVHNLGSFLLTRFWQTSAVYVLDLGVWYRAFAFRLNMFPRLLT